MPWEVSGVLVPEMYYISWAVGPSLSSDAGFGVQPRVVSCLVERGSCIVTVVASLWPFWSSTGAKQNLSRGGVLSYVMLIPDTYTETAHMHSHERGSDRERYTFVYALTRHADQTKTRACTWAIAAQVQAYIVRRQQTSALSILYGSGATVVIRKVKHQVP